MVVEACHEGGLRLGVAFPSLGQRATADVPREYGGPGELPGPMDLLEAGLATCVLGGLLLVARRAGVDLGDVRTRVERTMDASGRQIASLAVTVTVPQPVAPELRAQLELMAQNCPVHRSLSPAIDSPITFVWGG